MSDPDEEYLMDEGFARDQDPRISAFPTGKSFPELKLREEVIEALTFCEGLDPREINVDVRNEVVTLTGQVFSEAEKTLAFESASDVDDVVFVINELRVRPLHTTSSR